MFVYLQPAQAQHHDRIITCVGALPVSRPPITVSLTR